MKPNSIYDDLESRGLIYQVTDKEAVEQLLSEKKISLYIGFDPTASSLHIGSLLPIVVLARFKQYGHRTVALVGGATGMVGDPSFKATERALKTEEEIQRNKDGIRHQLESILGSIEGPRSIVVDNYSWFRDMGFLECLRDVGKYFSINQMVSRDSVKQRLENREQGISFTEFSYLILQAYDFLHLFRNEDCILQGGGSDQWGNITAGSDLIRKSTGKQAFGITFPLITSSSGEKFGKSEGNAVWLDGEMTTPYQFYQYWINSNDEDAVKYLKYFTFLSLEKIHKIIAEHAESPGRRLAQRVLAEEVTRLVHGESGLVKAQKASKVLFGGDIKGFSDRELLEIFAEVPSGKISRITLEKGINIVNLAVESGFMSSKGEARRTIKSGGFNLNNERVNDPMLLINEDSLVSESLLVLRMGKKNYYLIRIKSD